VSGRIFPFYTLFNNTAIAYRLTVENYSSTKSNVVMWINVQRQNNIITHHIRYNNILVLFLYNVITDQYNRGKMVKTVTQIL